MAISPIRIATHGLLNSPLAVAAVRGRLGIEVDIPIQRGGDSSKGASYVKGTWIHPAVKLEEQILREDEEIMAVIMAAVKVLK